MAEHNKKYELSKIITKLPSGEILHRVRALRDIREGVKKGDLGGWVQTEMNLSQNNTCWIYGEAKCYNHGKVALRSILYDHAVVYDQALLTDEAKVGGTTIMRGITQIGEDAWLYGSHDYNCKASSEIDLQTEGAGLDEHPLHVEDDPHGL